MNYDLETQAKAIICYIRNKYLESDYWYKSTSKKIILFRSDNIAELCGNKGHATVMDCLKKIEDYVET